MDENSNDPTEMAENRNSEVEVKQAIVLRRRLYAIGKNFQWVLRDGWDTYHWRKERSPWCCIRKHSGAAKALAGDTILSSWAEKVPKRQFSVEATFGSQRTFGNAQRLFQLLQMERGCYQHPVGTD